jgi:heptosyltransferase-1
VGARQYVRLHCAMAKNILLIKTSSLGDVIHTLPVVSDIRFALPDATVDWVIEEAYLPIPALHPGLRTSIPIAIRRWRRSLYRRDTQAENIRFLSRLRAQSYDAVIDLQGLLKSALIARAARGTRFGLDWRSAREPLSLFYNRTYRIPWSLHAVERNRSLAAQALGYPVPERLDYAIAASPGHFEWLGADPYAVLLHGSSGDHKLWAEEDWVGLGRHFDATGIHCVLPSGNDAESERSKRIAEALARGLVAPALGLDELAALLAGACAVIGVDTGLTHLAAALGRPTVGIYVATDPAATGIYGCARALNVGTAGGPPAVADVIAALERLSA